MKCCCISKGYKNEDRYRIGRIGYVVDTIFSPFPLLTLRKNIVLRLGCMHFV